MCKYIRMKEKSLKQIGEDLMAREQMLSAVCDWWQEKISLAMSQYIYIGKKLQEEWDENLFDKMQSLEQEINFLNTKKDFELKEYNRLQTEQVDYAQKVNKDFNQNLFKSLNKVLNKKP